MMKKYFLTAVFALFIGTGIYAQTPGQGVRKEWNPELIAKRKADKLMLDDAAMTKFMPLYQEYLEALKENRGTKESRQNKALLTDEEMDKMMQDRFERQQKNLDIQKKYYDKFKKILNMRQVRMLYQNGPVAGQRAGKKAMGPRGRKGHPTPGECPMPCQQGECPLNK